MNTTTQTCGTFGCSAPETADHHTLHSTSDHVLLVAFASLTHRLDGARRNLTSQARIDAYQDIRAQRDLVHAEVLRRMGGDR